MPLTSARNPLLQKVRRAVEQGRPLEDGTVAAEGPHLLAEALRSPWRVEHIFCSCESAARHAELLAEASRQGIEIIEVGARNFKVVSDTEQNQGVLCLIRPRSFEWRELLSAKGPLVLLDGIQDPGNAGAIVRSAEAFVAAALVFTEGCVRTSNGKFLRAAAGSIFRLPYLENVQRSDIVRELKAARRPIFSLVASGGVSLSSACPQGAFALAVGSEGAGVSEELLKASGMLSIPTRGVESLNAAIACSIALYEAARQRES